MSKHTAGGSHLGRLSVCFAKRDERLSLAMFVPPICRRKR